MNRDAAGANGARGALEDVTEVSDRMVQEVHPLVSVVMTAYMHERYLAEAVAGVMAQETDFDYELLIGEDCSPDRTREIALSLQGKHPDRIRVLYGPANIGGLANARRLMRAARGAFTAFCEGDDFWHHPGKLQMQIEAMREDAEVMLCYTDIDRRIGNRVRPVIQRNREILRHREPNGAYVFLLKETPVMTATPVYRKKLIDEFMDSEFNRPDWPFGDYNKALFAAVKGKVLYLPVSTATWRKTPGSVTNSGLRARFRMGCAYAECREAFMVRFPVPPDVEREVRARGYRRLAADAFALGNEGKYRESWKWLTDHGYKPGRVGHFFRIMAIKSRLYPKLAALIGHSISVATIGKRSGSKTPV